MYDDITWINSISHIMMMMMMMTWRIVHLQKREKLTLQGYRLQSFCDYKSSANANVLRSDLRCDCICAWLIVVTHIEMSSWNIIMMWCLYDQCLVSHYYCLVVTYNKSPRELVLSLKLNSISHIKRQWNSTQNLGHLTTNLALSEVKLSIFANILHQFTRVVF